ncbi:MAG: 3-dehydroquinate synthase [Bacteroidetes bacterium]|nr:3-dehydroquinate synthase [Bacteroidota bacterium]
MNTKINYININDLRPLFREDNVIIVVDNSVYNYYKYMFVGFEDKVIVIGAKEAIGGCKDFVKDFATFECVCNELIRKKATINTHLYGIGGGNITDLVGFVAAVYLRGIKVSFVPTTLLGMVDASIGGKNAINIGFIKNALGSVYYPSNVYIITQFLENLPKDLLLNGFAEILKTGLLFDINLLNVCFKYLDNNDINKLNDIISLSVTHKMKIISEDNFNNRAFLNFGHTIGHLLELDYNLSHGNAVAIGMVYESQIAVLLNLIDICIFNEIHRIITKYFNYNIEDYDLVKSAEKILLDKKIIGDKIKVPVISEIGRAKLVEIKLNDYLNCISMKFNLTSKK